MGSEVGGIWTDSLDEAYWRALLHDEEGHSAQETGVDKSNIVNFLNNKKGIAFTNLEKICKNLDLVLKDR